VVVRFHPSALLLGDVQYLRRSDSFAPHTPVARVDEYVRLAELRENSLFKVDTLIGALERFRRGLAAEVELAQIAG
jgi:hypothetical protein